MRIQASQINLTVGDIEGNAHKVLQALDRARKGNIDIVLFSELTLIGYPPEDLLLDEKMIQAVEQKLAEIAPATVGLFVAIGVARKSTPDKEKSLHNSAAIFIDGALVGYTDKVLLPEYDVFDERRFFEPQEPGGQAVYTYKGQRIGITICEDAWQHAGVMGEYNYSRDPIRELLAQKIDVMLNLSASPYHFKKRNNRVATFVKMTKTLQCPVVMCNQVGGNDQIVFDGHSLYINRKGEVAAEAKGFVEDDLVVDIELEAPAISVSMNEVEDLFSALVLGVRDYFQKQNLTHAIIGLSGGIDSAVTACLAVEALGKAQVRVLNLPSRYSSLSGQQDAVNLAKNLRVEMQSISIDRLFQNYLDTLHPFFFGA